MATYWVGTSGYNYRQWKGPFYPPDLPDQDMLRYYASRFRTVEINYTFYRTPSVRQLHGWAKEVPERFTFALKAPRRITHDLRLRDTADEVGEFCELAGSLQAKLGAVLFQLPPFLKRDVARLEDFLHQTPPGLRLAFEFRNASWFTDEVYECLRRFGAALCVVESPERTVPLEATANFGYFRLRNPEYTDDDLAERAGRIQERAGAWEDVFVYFKHEAEGRGPRYAAKLQSLLEPPTLAAAEL